MEYCTTHVSTKQVYSYPYNVRHILNKVATLKQYHNIIIMRVNVTEYLRSLLHKLSNTVVEDSAAAVPVVSGMRIFKDLNGDWRWFGWTTNHFLDDDGDIITDAAHKEFAAYLDENPDKAPYLWSWHEPLTQRKHRVDWWDYFDGFFAYSGKLTEQEAKEYQGIDLENVGMSHQFYAIKVGKYITRYRTFEVSDLPRDKAANKYTGFHIFVEETKEMNPAKRAYLAALLGEEKVKEIEEGTKTASAALIEAGIESKALQEDFDEFLADYTDEKAEEKAEKMVTNVVDQIMDALNIKELQAILADFSTKLEVVPALEAELKELKATVAELKEADDKRIDNIFAASEPLNWLNAKEEVAAEELTEEEKKEVVKAKEGFSWLSAVVGDGGV